LLILWGASIGLIVIPWLLDVCAPNDILAYSIVNTVAGFLAMVSIVYWLVDYWADNYLEEKNKSPDEYVTFTIVFIYLFSHISLFIYLFIYLN
jgi:uncharacterized protein YacL